LFIFGLKAKPKITNTITAPCASIENKKEYGFWPSSRRSSKSEIIWEDIMAG
jgi:hypothetical protein